MLFDGNMLYTKIFEQASKSSKLKLDKVKNNEENFYHLIC